MSKCPKCGSEYFEVREDNTCLSCGWQRKTVFHRITQSPETLANEFVAFDHGLYYSWFIGQYFNTYTEALAATVAKLKEVVE